MAAARFQISNVEIETWTITRPDYRPSRRLCAASRT